MNNDLKPELKRALSTVLLAFADDELVLAHRDSEWTGHAPILEEDIAFSNIAQDELGHAGIWYMLLEELTGKDPDELVFFRQAGSYRNVQLVELPKGDWAFSMVRQYLFDALEIIRASYYASSSYRPLREAMAKIRNEELYHYRHTSNWILRLGLGTEESNHRCQQALNQIWPYAAQLFLAESEMELLADEAVIPAQEELQRAWSEMVLPFLQKAGLTIPVEATPVVVSRTEHSEHLPKMLAELQEVARLDPRAEW